MVWSKPAPSAGPYTLSGTFSGAVSNGQLWAIELYGAATVPVTIVYNSATAGLDVVPSASPSYSTGAGIRTFKSYADYEAGRPNVLIGFGILTQGFIGIVGGENGFGQNINFPSGWTDSGMLGIWPDTPQGIIIRQSVASGNNAILVLEQTGPLAANYGYTFGIDATGLLTWAASTNTSVTGWDTSLWRSAANTLSLGITTGTPDASGTLKCATLIEGATLTPASATTAGVTGQIAWQGTNGTTGQIFVCTAGGSAGSAIWMAATLAKV